MASSIDVSGRKFVIKFRPKPSDQVMREVKLLPLRSWNHYSRCWEVPINPGSIAAVRAFVRQHEIELTNRATEALSERQASGNVQRKNNVLLIEHAATDQADALIGSLLGRYDYVESCWRLPITPEVIVQFPSIAADLGLKLDEEVTEFLERRRPAAERVVIRQADLYEMSRQAESDLVVPGFLGDRYPYQSAAAEYAKIARRTFIGDPTGVGKTASAVLSLLELDAFPALIVTPSNVKLKWAESIEQWAPHLSVVTLSGTTPQPSLELQSADIVVVNYDILSPWTGWVEHRRQGRRIEENIGLLAEMEWRAHVYDESQNLKNAGTKRAQSAELLTKLSVDDAVILMTTATATKSDPEELIEQLKILDRLQEFGGATQFKRRYCDDPPSEHLVELNRKLRERCYVRRRKQDVLSQLPEMRRAVVPLELDNAQEYKRAEEDVVEWLVDTGMEEGVAKNYTQAVVHMNVLKKLAAKGKLKAAISWVKDFIQDEKLVLFAHHVEIQNALLEAFPGSERIQGAQTAQQKHAAVERFQTDRDCRLIVCSMQAGSVGATLTAASNVAFLEMGWTPGDHDQAEGRVHRIGQDKGCIAWYLLAADTIDETIAQLIEAKRAATTAVNEGELVDTGGSVIEELVNAMVRPKKGAPDDLPDQTDEEQEAEDAARDREENILLAIDRAAAEAGEEVDYTDIEATYERYYGHRYGEE